MLKLTHSPSLDTIGQNAFYCSAAQEGFVHSAIMCGEHYEKAKAFDERWAFDAITWSAGGVEQYRFESKALSVTPAGVLTISAGERYSYKAGNDAPFRSNMIAFPQWITRSARERQEFDGVDLSGARLSTRLCRPSPDSFALMNEMANRCIAGEDDDAWFVEHAALLYARLLRDQETTGADDLDAVKAATRAELARRIERSAQYILEAYSDPALTVSALAKEACLSRFHFIRVFKSVKHETPMQFLTAVRMDAAHRLLRHSVLSISEIARAVGYLDRASFIRAFKRRFSETPSAARMA
ncbi:MAG: AraC family transcriptional regulator [Hyphococcus sp.]